MDKKYDEALERAKKQIEACGDNEGRKRMIYAIFPELVDNKDEDIRKDIIEYLKLVGKGDGDYAQPMINRWIAYLEREKYDRMKPIYDAKESFESALEKAWNDYHNGYENVDKFEDDYVKCAHAKGFREGCLFGIEKQKEQKWSPSEGEMGVLYKLCYISNQITDEDDTELTRLYQDLKREYFNGHSFENMFSNEKQKEQKPLFKQISDSVIWDSGLRTGIELGKKEQKPNIELIQCSWYMEGYYDREFGKEPKWIIKTGKGGPKYEENPKYGQMLEAEQKPIKIEAYEVGKGTTICGQDYKCKKDYKEGNCWYIKDVIYHCGRDGYLTDQNGVSWSCTPEWFNEYIYTNSEWADKEKNDFVSGQFLQCKLSFDEFKEGEHYWLEYIGDDMYVGRSDNILNQKFHITPRQLYTLFSQQLDVNEEEQNPTNSEKPKEWSEDFEENIRTLLHNKLAWHSEDGSMSSTVLIDDKTLKDIVSGIWFYVGKEALKYPNKEIHVPEWSEEDKEAYDMCYDAIPKAWKTKSGKLLTEWLKDKLKSLPERFNLQPKQEWSEEDKKVYAFVYDFFENCWWNKTWDMSREQVLKTLKSLRPQPRQETNIDKLHKISTKADEDWLEIQKQWEKEDKYKSWMTDYFRQETIDGHDWKASIIEFKKEGKLSSLWNSMLMGRLGMYVRNWMREQHPEIDQDFPNYDDFEDYSWKIFQDLVNEWEVTPTERNIEDVAAEYIEGVKSLHEEPDWNLMHTAVIYGYQLGTEKCKTK